MIRVSALGGRAVVDLDAAEKLGRIDKIILDPDGRQVAGFVVSRGSSLFNSGTDTVLPASSVHAIGPDAVTVRVSKGAAAETAPLDTLPRVSDLVGRKVVSEEGRFLGTVDDILVDEADGRIVGYALAGSGPAGKLGSMVAGDRKDEQTPYLRAEADLRAGVDLIVAPENAVSRDWALLGPSVDETAPVTDSPVRRWVDTTSSLRGPTQWVRSGRGAGDPLAIKPGGDL